MRGTMLLCSLSEAELGGMLLPIDNLLLAKDALYREGDGGDAGCTIRRGLLRLVHYTRTARGASPLRLRCGVPSRTSTRAPRQAPVKAASGFEDMDDDIPF